MSKLRSGIPHRGREAYCRVTDPAHAWVGGATLETRHLKRMRVSVTASKLIFEQTPRLASGFPSGSLIPSPTSRRILGHSELTDEAEGRFGVGL
jgi:hypothetical protein